MKKHFAFCTLFWVVFHLSVKLYAHFCAFPFSFGKTKLSLRLFVLFCSFSTQIFLLFSCQRSLSHQALVGLDGLEPSTSRLSGARSSHLSYKPEFTHRLWFVHLFARLLWLVEMKGIEPLTPCLQGRCSPSWATPPFKGFALTVSMICKLSPTADHWQLNNKISQHSLLVMPLVNSPVGL